MKNNKGFSLVELIIVIAIMAVLIGVMAPQYIKYVEKSRISTDEDNADQILTCVKTALSDDAYIPSLTSDNTVKWTKEGGIDTNDEGLKAALTDTLGDSYSTDYSIKSTKYSGSNYTVTITYTKNAWYATGAWSSGT